MAHLIDNAAGDPKGGSMGSWIASAVDPVLAALTTPPDWLVIRHPWPEPGKLPEARMAFTAYTQRLAADPIAQSFAEAVNDLRAAHPALKLAGYIGSPGPIVKAPDLDHPAPWLPTPQEIADGTATLPGRGDGLIDLVADDPETLAWLVQHALSPWMATRADVVLFDAMATTAAGSIGHKVIDLARALLALHGGRVGVEAWPHLDPAFDHLRTSPANDPTGCVWTNFEYLESGSVTIPHDDLFVFAQSNWTGPAPSTPEGLEALRLRCQRVVTYGAIPVLALGVVTAAGVTDLEAWLASG